MNHVQLVEKVASAIRVQEFESRTGGDPKVKASFILVVRRAGKDKDPDWIRVETWGRQATNLVRFNDKGSRIAVVGSIRGQFYNPDGKERGGQLRAAVVADEITYLTPPAKPEVEAEAEEPAKAARR
ncbi:MAG: single-stranded DNA-binding protein [Candidatus Dormibacteria bacterium]